VIDLSELYKLIRRFEGCRLRAYLCPTGVWTVGWGTTGPEIGPGTVWSQAQADARMEADARRFAHRSLALCPNLVHWDGSACAVADFAYNLGLGALRSSTLRRKILAEDWDGAGAEFGRWVRAGGKVLRGLVLRRAEEARLFAEG